MIGLRKAALPVGVIAVLLVSVWGAIAAFSYRTSEFTGGAGIRDSGLFYYPRYHAYLGELPLWKDGEYSFTVHGLPSGPLDFNLQVVDATHKDRAELETLNTSVSVLIADSNNKEMCKVTGRLSNAESGNRAGWVLTSSDLSASFWQGGCSELPISRFKTYTARVVVLGANERSPHKMLRPTLQGGGIELP